MLLTEFKHVFFEELKSIYPTTEIDSFFNLLVEYHLKLSRTERILHPEFEIANSSILILKNSVSQLKKQIPIQYIIGETEFFNLKFNVNKNVLIPRPETEELVQWILNDYNSNSAITILDIGTGSGCIAISLAANLSNVKVHALDISPKAIETAKENAKRNNVSINFIELDILNTKILPQSFDIIVSNPPYIRSLEKIEMQPNVLNFEPHLALFVEDENPLLFYEKITQLAKKYLKKNGNLYFEINQYLGEETSELIKCAGFKNIELKKDFFEVNRMIKAST